MKNEKIDGGRESNGDPSCSLYPWNGPQRPAKETEGIGDQWKNRGHTDYSTFKISSNTFEET